jgi:hypothetical protein
MEEINEVDKSKQIALIEDGLEGVWVLDTIVEQPNKKYLSFIKPNEIGGWGKLMLSERPDIVEYVLLEYEVLVSGDNNAFINVRVMSVGQIIQYALDFLNSWQGILRLDDSNGLRHYYNRLIPRTLSA